MPVIIKMKGLPFESTSKDIQSFFEGLYIKQEDIHLAAYKDGKASGIAFAVFQNDEDARQAMFRNEKYMGKRYIELFLSSTTEMNSMLDDGVPDPRPTRRELNEDQRIMRERERDNQFRSRNIPDRRGKPQNRPEADRRGFSARDRSRSPKGRRLERESVRGSVRGRGRAGESFRSSRGNERRSANFDERRVEMTPSLSLPMFSLAENIGKSMGLGSERMTMGGSMASGARFDRGRLGDSFGDNGQRRKSSREESSLGRRERTRAGDPLLDEVCVQLGSLPFIIAEAEVTSFFKGLDVVQVKFLHHPDGKFAGRKTGEGYVEFRSVCDAKIAQKKNRQKLGHRFIDIRLITKLDMIKAVEKNETDIKKADLMGGSAVIGGAVSDLAVNINQDLLRQAQTTSRMMDRRHDLSSLGLPLAGSYGISADSLEAQTINTLSQLASTAKINPDDVAAGCVVGIRNLPSSVTANEIIDLFYGYHVFRDSVRIHYLAPGRSSGDAMVTLRNSKEAMAAIQELNHKHVGKRSVQLFLV